MQKILLQSRSVGRTKLLSEQLVAELKTPWAIEPQIIGFKWEPKKLTGHVFSLA